MKVHTVKNNGNIIKCELSKNRNSKNIRMRIDNSGIVKVTLPYFTPYIIAKNFVNHNIDWIEKKLALFKLQKNTYYYLGKNIRLINIFDSEVKRFNYYFFDNELTIRGNIKNKTSDELFFDWLRQRALEYIPKRVEDFSSEYEFNYNTVKIKKLTSRWGSCSSKKNLSFNLKLMYFNYEVIDYVIVHELCHLKEMNHSKKFWNLVEEIIPNYKDYRKELNIFFHK